MPSLDDLRTRVAKFIDFNDVLAKPFRWTYTGRRFAHERIEISAEQI